VRSAGRNPVGVAGSGRFSGWESPRSTNVWILPLAVASLAIGYAARITRWWLMLRASAPTLGWTSAGAPFLISIAANNVLPLRAGDVLRMFAFRGDSRLGPSRVAGTLIVERLLDLLSLLIIFVAVLPAIPAGEHAGSLRTLAIWAGAAGLVGVAGLFCLPIVERFILEPLSRWTFVVSTPLAGKAIGAARMLIGTIGNLMDPRRLAGLMLLSGVAWVFEGGVFIVAASAVGIDASAVASFLALAVATLSTLIPSSPGYVGTFHFFAIEAARLFDAPPAAAAVFAIVSHLLLWLPTTLAGLFVFLWASVRGGHSRAVRAPSMSDTLP
jgi:uncharacterized membrane protein YbhN (UPF0104 family)